jgi:hypothetical protein
MIDETTELDDSLFESFGFNESKNDVPATIIASSPENPIGLMF